MDDAARRRTVGNVRGPRASFTDGTNTNNARTATVRATKTIEEEHFITGTDTNSAEQLQHEQRGQMAARVAQSSLAFDAREMSADVVRGNLEGR